MGLLHVVSVIIGFILFGCVVSSYLSVVFSVGFLSFGGKAWWLMFGFDEVTLLVSFMLVLCFVYVYNYTGHYFGNSVGSVGLNNIVVLFVVVMLILVWSSDLLLSLIFWEFLGVVSFFLILFYGNYLSLRSSVITLISSRFGDVAFFLLIGLSAYVVNVWYWICVVFGFILFTKSAVFPYVSWLLEAMRAPTPVSSLVHSSTLVAAGVCLAMRYDMMNYFGNFFLFSIVLLTTIFVSGICCFFFVDLKKIIALSTCNNISWCLLYLIFGDLMLSLFQLISHGVSKCMLFILAGDNMSGSGGSQDENCVYGSVLYGNCNIFSLCIVILGLSGIPFIGVFFTKHLLLASFSNVLNLVLFAVIVVCVFVSYFYSFRLCVIVVNFKSSISTGVLYFFNNSFIVSIWLFVNYLFSLNLDESSISIFPVSVLLLFFQLVCCVISYYFYSSLFFSSWSSSLFGCDNLVELFYHIFNRFLFVVQLFFYRWDELLLSYLCFGGSELLGRSVIGFLNVVVTVLFLLLFVCVYVLA